MFVFFLFLQLALIFVVPNYNFCWCWSSVADFFHFLYRIFKMVTVIFKYIRSLFGFFLRMLYPLKRLLCRRRKLSTSEPLELTSIKTGDSIQVPLAFGGLHQNEPEPEVWMIPSFTFINLVMCIFNIHLSSFRFK